MTWQVMQRLSFTNQLNLQGVDARRAEVRKYAGDPAYKKKIDEERRAKKKAEVRQLWKIVLTWLQACESETPVSTLTLLTQSLVT